MKNDWYIFYITSRQRFDTFTILSYTRMHKPYYRIDGIKPCPLAEFGDSRRFWWQSPNSAFAWTGLFRVTWWCILIMVL